MQRKNISDKDRAELVEELLKLAKKIIKKIETYKSKDQLIKIPYQKIPVKDIKYDTETYYLDWKKIENFDYLEWPWQLSSKFHDQIIKYPEFDAVVLKLESIFTTVTNNAVRKIGLPKFTSYITNNALNGYITIGNINYFIDLFIADYIAVTSDNKYNWRVTVSLSNIKLESSEIEIYPNVYLRRPSKKQLENVGPKPTYISQYASSGGRLLESTAILSFPIKTGKGLMVGGRFNKDIVQEVDVWMNILRLFRPANIVINYQVAIPDSIMEYQASQRFDAPQDKVWQGKVDSLHTSHYKYQLNLQEEELFKGFVKKMKPILNEVSHTNYLGGNAYDLALHRYNDSLIKSELNAYKIFSCMTSLEALLSNENMEITFKIRLRLSSLLRFFGFDGKNVSLKIRDAYSLRSKLVHGSSADTKEQLEFARDNTRKIINYNRLCLIIMLQLRKLIAKDRLIELLNDACIDDVKLEELRVLVLENVEIPILRPFINDTED
jgi:hypothetical protein